MKKARSALRSTLWMILNYELYTKIVLRTVQVNEKKRSKCFAFKFNTMDWSYTKNALKFMQTVECRCLRCFEICAIYDPWIMLYAKSFSRFVPGLNLTNSRYKRFLDHRIWLGCSFIIFCKKIFKIFIKKIFKSIKEDIKVLFLLFFAIIWWSPVKNTWQWDIQFRS